MGGWTVAVLLVTHLETPCCTPLTREHERTNEDGAQWYKGKFHDQGDAKGIVVRGPLRHHNDMPCRRPMPSRPFGRPYLVVLVTNN
jgi:hypothetical protein